DQPGYERDRCRVHGRVLVGGRVHPGLRSGVRASARSHHGRKWHVVARTERYPFPPTVPPVGGEGTEGASHDGPDRVADPPRRGRHHPPHRTSHAAGRGEIGRAHV